jgi:hypothetical protein
MGRDAVDPCIGATGRFEPGLLYTKPSAPAPRTRVGRAAPAEGRWRASCRLDSVRTPCAWWSLRDQVLIEFRLRFSTSSLIRNRSGRMRSEIPIASSVRLSGPLVSVLSSASSPQVRLGIKAARPNAKNHLLPFSKKKKQHSVKARRSERG